MNQRWTRYLPPPLRSRLDGRHTLQRIMANTGWLFADRLLRLGVGLAVGVWVARYLGPGQFGLYNYALAFVGMFGVLSTLGLDSIVIRELVRDPAGRDEILGTTLLLKLAGGVALLVVSVGSIQLVRPDDELSHLLVAVISAGTIFQSVDAVDFWFQSQVKSKFTVVARDSAFLVLVLVRVALILLQAPLLAFVVAGVAETVLGAAASVIAYRASGNDPRKWRGSFPRAVSLLRSSWPLMLSGLAIWVYMRIDQLMIGGMVDDRAVGIYSAAVRLSEVWYFVPVAITASVFPSLVEYKTSNERIYADRVQRLFNVLVALSYVVIVPVTLLAQPIVVLLYGPSYADAGAMLAVLMWTGVFVALGVARESWIVAEGLMKYSFLSTVIGAICNVTLNLLLIPLHGALAAPVATLLSQFAAVTLSMLLSRKTWPVFRMQMKALVLWGGLRL